MTVNDINLIQNTAERSFVHEFAENGLSLYTGFESKSEDLHAVKCEVPSRIIQFYFCLEGHLEFNFSPYYQKQLQSGQYFFMYNPQKDLVFDLIPNKVAKWVAAYTTVDKLHTLFVDESDVLTFLNGENAAKPLYDERECSSSVKWALESLFTSELSAASRKIFAKGKLLEVLALHFDRRSEDTEACPFLRDEKTRTQIKSAKNVLIERITQPPSIAELALDVGISEYKLKSGFKEMYGNTVGGFILDYKMNTAKSMLDSRNYQVSEVAYALGYGNPSHFITAFKKKYQITPKKYLQQL
ncbi:AraC family transcriptional regulator [Schleiferiaceae bacterium]|jgi:AraC-like DNA-binding protein|nr:AraC family transcriptional regulator [Schleiferiaceae bacterium]